MKQLYKLILPCLLSFSNNLVYSQSPVTIDFTKGIPNNIHSLCNSLSLDTLRFKRGNQSLKWMWKGNDCITIDGNVGYKKQSLVYENVDGHGGSKDNPILDEPKAFVMWIYNEHATTQRLRVQFGRKNIVDCEFDYELNFTGWRTMVVGFDRGDMRGVPREDMDRITFLAPSAGSGTFYFDMIKSAVGIDPKVAAPSAQLPNIKLHPRLVTQYEERIMENSRNRPTMNLEELTSKDIDAFRKMEKLADDLYFPSYERASTKDSKLDNIRKTYNDFNIHRKGEYIYGKPLMDSQVYYYYKDYSETVKDIRKHTKFWRDDFSNLSWSIASLYTQTSNNEIKKELADKFINLFDYAVDQGFDVGESLGWINHYSYRIRPIFPAMFYMRNVLKQYGKLDKAISICRFYSQLNMFYNKDVVYGVKGRKASDADYTQGLLTEALLTILMQDDSSNKLRDLKQYSDYFSSVTAQYANALDECFKPDGMVFHHAGKASGYGGRALAGAIRAIYLLSGSNYPASVEAIAHIKKALLITQKTAIGDNYSVPKAFSSIRFDSYDIPKQFLSLPATLALSTNKEDDELISLFCDIYKKEKSPDSNMDFWNKKIKSRFPNVNTSFNYSGFTMLPYASVATQRSASDWMITVRGYNKYMFSFESWGTSYFNYPLYIGNGFMDISYGNNLDSTTGSGKTLWMKGYDWHRWPGTTTVRLPYEKMLTNPGQVRDEPGEYLCGDIGFAGGGVATSYNTGIFVFPFKGHDKFGLESFTGNKSYFFYEDKVLCLGSDIHSDVSNCDVETTLFQTSLDQNVRCKAVMNGKPLDSEVLTKGNRNVWFVDNRGTGYFVPEIPTNVSLNIFTGAQSNPAYKDNQELTTGKFSSVWFNHGVTPKSSDYKYMMIANTTPEKMSSLSKREARCNKVFSVVQQNKDAHIVKLNDINATAYAVFASDGLSFKSGIIKSVNRQSTFFTRQLKNDKLILSVADPDLNIYDGQDDLLPNGKRCELSIYEREWFYWPSRPIKIVITLNGQWDIEKQILEMETAQNKSARIIKTDKKVTLIEVECKDGLSSEVLLKKR